VAAGVGLQPGPQPQPMARTGSPGVTVRRPSGVVQLVERQPLELVVAGSSPAPRASRSAPGHRQRRGRSSDAAIVTTTGVRATNVPERHPDRPTRPHPSPSSWPLSSPTARSIIAPSASAMARSQHREVLVLAGWLALLVGCVEYDTKDLRSAKATRQAAASLGQEADHAGIMAWAQEMTCWFALTGPLPAGDRAARAGHEMAPHQAVSVQLAGQEAKAWARMGHRRQVELALERGRRLLESLPYRPTSTTTSRSIPTSSTSTPWTATAAWARTRWRRSTPGR
jgi:hypothetical protein